MNNALWVWLYSVFSSAFEGWVEYPEQRDLVCSVKKNQMKSKDYLLSFWRRLLHPQLPFPPLFYNLFISTAWDGALFNQYMKSTWWKIQMYDICMDMNIKLSINLNGKNIHNSINREHFSVCLMMFVASQELVPAFQQILRCLDKLFLVLAWPCPKAQEKRHLRWALFEPGAPKGAMNINTISATLNKQILASFVVLTFSQSVWSNIARYSRRVQNMSV